MKTSLIAAAALAALLLGGAGTAVYAQRDDSQRDSRPEFGRRERHPELQRALRALRNARSDLQRGAHDFGGHRIKALRATDDAIRQVEEALRFDRR